MASANAAPVLNWERAQVRLIKERKLTSRCLEQPESCPDHVRPWQRKIAAWQGLSAEAKMEQVNRFANRAIRYTDDRKTFKASDYWATPLQSLRGRGDCEDYVLLKYETLLALGFAKQDLRIVVVMDQRKGIAHAVLSVATATGTFILDNQDKRVLRHDSISHYAPLYSLNEMGRWINIATRQVKSRKAAPVVLVASTADVPGVAPTVKAKRILKPAFKQIRSTTPEVASIATPRLQATASAALLRASVSIAAREPKDYVAPPTFMQRWATLFEPLLKLVG